MDDSPPKRPLSPPLDAGAYGTEAARQALHDRRDRIRAHMNQAHRPDMARLLRVFAAVDAAAVARARPSLEWVHFNGVLIALADAGDGNGDGNGDGPPRAKPSPPSAQYFIPFEPVLRGVHEIRPRLVAMDARARAKLGLGERLTRYVPPGGREAVVMVGVLLYILCVASLPWAVPETGYWALLDRAWRPVGGASGFFWLVRALRLPVLGIHLVEAVYFHFSRMRPLGVPTASALWLAWELSCALEGRGAFRRVDRAAMVDEAQKKWL